MSIRTKKIGGIDGCEIWIVSGVRVRNELDIDFTCGGHHLVYPSYVPAGEIWIDDVLGPLDRAATILHEAVEHFLMREKRWGYDRAHDTASSVELPFRSTLARLGQRMGSSPAQGVTRACAAFDRWLADLA
jgi:hypothetical protein